MPPRHIWTQETWIPSHVMLCSWLKTHSHWHVNTQGTFRDTDIPSLTLEANSVIL